MSRIKQTIYDIAREAEVSIATVSRVIRGGEKVSEATRKKVEDVILRLNYQPSAIARGLTQQHSRTLGIVLPKLTNPNYAMLFAGAYDEAAAQGYAISLFPYENMTLASLNPSELLAERRLDGVVICLEYISREDLEMKAAMLKSIRQYMPIVLIGNPSPTLPYPSVNFDLADCVRIIMEYLISLGHERIAMLGGFDELSIPYSRDAGYHAALKKARLPFVKQYRVFGKCTSEDGERLMNELLDNLKSSQWPSAVIAANDMVALGAIRAAEAHGIEIPSQLSVVGCDDLFFAAYNHPPLTSINTHQHEIGRRAVRLLLSESAEIRHELLPCELVLRESCAKASPV